MPATHHVLTLSDGRLLDVFEVGQTGAPTIVWLPGTPEGHGILTSLETAATAAGLRLISIARPGYAQSSRQPGRIIASVVTDVLEACDALGVKTFAVMGDSGGGPHALACGALAADRCLAVSILAGVGPFAAEGLDFLADMGATNEIEFGAVSQGEATLRPMIEEWRLGMLSLGVTRDASGQVDPESLGGIASLFESILSPPDQAVLNATFLAEFAESIAMALSTGADGWIDDDLAFVSPWGFEPAEVSVPVLVYQGEQDLMVPPAHGQWLAAQLPRSTFHLLPDDGHLTLLQNRAAEILAELSDYMNRPPVTS